MSLGRSLRTICAVSGSSVSGTTFGKLRELVEDVEWNVAMDDMLLVCCIMCVYVALVLLLACWCVSGVVVVCCLLSVKRE